MAGVTQTQCKANHTNLRGWFAGYGALTLALIGLVGWSITAGYRAHDKAAEAVQEVKVQTGKTEEWRVSMDDKFDAIHDYQKESKDHAIKMDQTLQKLVQLQLDLGHTIAQQASAPAICAPAPCSAPPPIPEKAPEPPKASKPELELKQR